jgi:hypothetical protein
MKPAVLRLVLDASVLIAAERTKLTTPEAIRKVREVADDVTIVICSLTVAELAHGIYRADTPEMSRMRRQFLDEPKAHVHSSRHRNRQQKLSPGSARCPLSLHRKSRTTVLAVKGEASPFFQPRP